MPTDQGGQPGDFNVDLGGGGGGGGSDNGGGGGGGGTAPSPPAVDPVEAAKKNAFQQVYQALWGEPATESYLNQAVNAGMNVWEFEERERHKPAFRKTKTYRDEATQWADILHKLGVA